MTTPTRRRCAQRGSSSVELALITPALLLLLGLVIVAGRVVVAGNSIEGVAAQAARQASLARSPEQARRVAESSATRSLSEQKLQCLTSSVTVDTSGFSRPLGQPAQIRVDVSCAVRLSDIGLPGLPGTRLLQDSFVSPLDPYRGRG